MTGEEVLAIVGLVLIVAGLITMIVPMVRATTGSSAVGRVPEPLVGLTPQEQADLRRRVEAGGTGKIAPRELPRLRATAEGMVARRVGLWFCLGGAIAGIGIAVSDPTDPLRLVFCVLILALTGFTARAVDARSRAGVTFLERHSS